MNTLNKYILMTICDEALKYFKTTKYMTFINFCNVFSLSFKSNNFSKNEIRFVSELMDLLNLIYALDDNASSVYIMAFFSLDNEMLYDYEKISKYMNTYYSICQ